VRKKPSMDAAKMLQRSLKGTFSLGINREMSQNSRQAPTDLKQNKPKELTKWALVSSLHIIILNPKIT